MSEKRETCCPRCGDPMCSDPDSKGCSDNCIGRYQRELADARAENTALRALQVGVKCAYGYRMDNGACQLGYPGCACMDDLVATMEWGPGDLSAQANKRLQERAEKAEAERDAAVKDAERWQEIRGQFSPLGLNIDGNHAWIWRGSPSRLKGSNMDAAIDAAIDARKP